jgi:hypothetical protein
MVLVHIVLLWGGGEEAWVKILATRPPPPSSFLHCRWSMPVDGDGAILCVPRTSIPLDGLGLGPGLGWRSSGGGVRDPGWRPRVLVVVPDVAP